MTLRDACLLHYRQRGIERQLCALLRRHPFRHAAERLRADAAVVTDLLQRLKEADEIDDALPWHHALVVADLLRRLSFSIGHVHVDDALLASGQDVRDRAARVMPVPDVENDADVGPAVLRE